MNITNKSNLPDAIVKAVENDTYTKGESDFSVTELLKPPRVRELQRRYADQLEEDAEDRLYSLYGQLVHSLLERANETDLVEKRFFGTFLGKVVSGQIDSLSIKDGVLSDYKFTTAWKFLAGKPPDPQFVAQLNMQLELLRMNGYDASKLQIVGLIRDFSKAKALRERDYPNSPVVTQDIPVWSREQTVAFIEERIRIHVAAQTELPECTTEDRWAKPDYWAVVKGKRAVSGGICKSLDAAQSMASEIKGSFVEYRPGENTRCDNYCSAAKFCTQYQALKKLKVKKVEETEEDF